MRWTVPKIWKDGECFIIGGGPSIAEQFEIPETVVQSVRDKTELPSIYSPYLSSIHNKHVIGVNVAYTIGNWMDFIFFGDYGSLFIPHRERLFEYPGIKVTCNDKARNYNWIKYLERDREKPRGISDHPAKVCWNSNSGAAAISLAANLGVKRIVLLGFDMTLVDDNSHWHQIYKKRGRVNISSSFNRHIRGFKEIYQDAQKMGIEILNASKTSTITQFAKINIKDVL